MNQVDLYTITLTEWLNGHMEKMAEFSDWRVELHSQYPDRFPLDQSAEEWEDSFRKWLATIKE